MLFNKHFFKYYLKYWWSFLLGLGVLITIDWFQLEIPRILKDIIDGLKEGTITNVSQVVPPIINIIIIVIGVTIGRYLWRLFLFGTARRIEGKIREEMFEHALILDQSYYANEKVGALMSYFTNDLYSIQELYGFGLLTITDGIVLGTFVLIRMFGLSVTMTIYAFIPIALMGVLIIFLERRMEKRYTISQEAFESLSDFTQETYSGIAIIKAYVKEASYSLGFAKKSTDLQNKGLAHISYSVRINVFVNFMINAVIIAILAFGSYLIATNTLSSGELSEYINYFFTLLWPVFAISTFFQVFAQAKSSSRRIASFLDAKPIVDENNVGLIEATLPGDIRFNNLSFAYPDDDKPVLKNISFHINEGEFVGILGRTGSGKSTLVELLLHIYKAPDDSIYFGTFDTAKLTAHSVREAIGYVPQDNFLFSDTIKANIGFSFKNPSEELVFEASRLAALHENVKDFKEGYNTMLGERGVTVSGGQKQRIAIARAIAKDPTILILDDSVSAVDTKTEETLIANLRKIRKGKTTLLIAHRISTVSGLDKIVLLEKGELVAFGTHKELLKTSELYKDMVKRQQLESLLEEGGNL